MQGLIANRTLTDGDAEWQPGQAEPAAALLQVALRMYDSGKCVAVVLVCSPARIDTSSARSQ